MAPEDLDRVAVEPAPHLAVHRAQPAEQVGQELGPVLDRRDAQVGELAQVVRQDQRQQPVMDGLLDGEVLERRGPAPGERGGEAVDRIAVGRDAAVAGVDDDGDPRLVDPGPERVEPGVERRVPARGGGRGRGAHDEHPGPLAKRPLQLLDGPVRVGEGDVGGGEDAVAVREAPVVVQPPVEGPEGGADGLGVVVKRLLVDHPERGEQPAPGQALLVEHAQSGLGIAVLGADRLVVAEPGERVDPVAVAPEVVVEAAGLGHRVEGGVRDGPAHPPAEHVILAAVDGRPLHAPGPERGVEVAGEGVDRFVVVVVRIEDRMPEVAHGPRVEHVLVGGECRCPP